MRIITETELHEVSAGTCSLPIVPVLESGSTTTIVGYNYGIVASEEGGNINTGSSVTNTVFVAGIGPTPAPDVPSLPGWSGPSWLWS